MAEELTTEDRVVIQYRDYTVKGFVEKSELEAVDGSFGSGGRRGMDSIRLRRLDSGAVEERSLKDAKAVFFVKTFEGDVRHTALHFHNHAPLIQNIWVRIHFNDGEVMEGFIKNDYAHVMEGGFFLTPTDPLSNNKAVYVLKDKIQNFEVLGLRNPSR